MKYVPVPERFWPKVNKRSGTFGIDGTFPTECWEWIASVAKNGYGEFNINRRSHGSHRVAWELTVGPIPSGLWVLHQCDNRKCVNPDHLFLGTVTDNNKDKIKKGRSNRGEKHGHAKLTAKDVVDIRIKVDSGITQTAIAKIYGVDPSTISYICNNKTWSFV